MGIEMNKIFNINNSKPIVEKIANSYVLYNENGLNTIRQYYLYCLQLIKKELNNENYAVNLIFGNYYAPFPGKNKIFKIDIQYEHTLVKPGGRDSEGAVTGNIQLNDIDFYLIRIAKKSYYKSLDFIIDYSFPNLINISSNQLFESIAKKSTVISPVLYPLDKNLWIQPRKNNIITTFINEKETRRSIILERFKTARIAVQNIVDKFSTEDVKSLYSNSKILVNIHQTPYHDTFEELRVLPALLCGCIVISENVPLKEHIPYHNHIIWADYEDIVDVTKDVSENYDYYVEKIFDAHLEETINNLTIQNKNNIRQMLLSLNQRKHGRMVIKDKIKYYLKLCIHANQ